MDPSDKVAIVTGIIGAITGSFALVRGMYLQRRLYLEPYFRKKWLQENAGITGYLNAVKNLHRAIELDLESKNPEELHSIVYSNPIILENIDWTYDKKAKSLISKVISMVKTIQMLATQYNELRYWTSDRLQTEQYLCEVLPIMIKEDSASDEANTMKLDKMRERYEAKSDSGLKVLKQYGLNKESLVGELRKSAAYIDDLSSLTNRIVSNIAVLELSINRAEAKIDFLTTKFANDT